MMILTATAFIIILHYLKWRLVFNEVHTVCGMVTLTFIGFLVLTGSIAMLSRKKAPDVWQTTKFLKKGRVHRLIAYTVLVMS